MSAKGTTFEPNVATLEERIATFMELAGCIGPDRVVWRYDPGSFGDRIFNYYFKNTNKAKSDR